MSGHRLGSQPFGTFSDEGMVDGPFYSRQAAEEALAEMAAEQIAENGGDPVEDVGMTVEPICPDHEDQPADACEHCNEEEES